MDYQLLLYLAKRGRVVSLSCCCKGKLALQEKQPYRQGSLAGKPALESTQPPETFSPSGRVPVSAPGTQPVVRLQHCLLSAFFYVTSRVLESFVVAVVSCVIAKKH